MRILLSSSSKVVRLLVREQEEGQADAFDGVTGSRAWRDEK